MSKFSYDATADDAAADDARAMTIPRRFLRKQPSLKNIPIFSLRKCERFCNAKASHIFSTKILP